MKLYQSSTWRELKAVEITLKGCVDLFKNKFVKILTDNQNVERISEVGSMKKDLQSLAIDIFHFCIQNCICLKLQ
jgi:hypothetical protein